MAAGNSHYMMKLVTYLVKQMEMPLSVMFILLV